MHRHACGMIQKAGPRANRYCEDTRIARHWRVKLRPRSLTLQCRAYVRLSSLTRASFDVER